MSNELAKVARAALDWIDALPDDVVAKLPTMPGFDRDWAEETIKATGNPPAQPELAVSYGAMPETNGKSNWTAMLHRKAEGIMGPAMTIARSEFPDRVRFEADEVRYLIGELVEQPDMLAYDMDKHSGYVAPKKGD